MKIPRRALLLITFAAIACLPAGVQESVAQAKMSLKFVFATPPTTAWLPYFVAKDLGWLDRAGLKMEEIWLTGDANAIRALLAGQGDMTGTGVFATYSALVEGAKIKAIGSSQPTVDYQLLAHEKIRSVKDLAGARVGAAGPRGLVYEIPRLVMKKHGVDPNSASFASIGGHDARMQAVVAGKVDVALVGLLYTAKATREFKNVRVLTTIRDEFPGLAYVYLVVNEKDLVNPEKRKAFETYVRLAVVEGSRFIMKNPDKAAEIMHGRTPDLKLDLIKEVVQALNRLNVWGVNGGLEPEVTEFTAKLAHDLGSIKRAVSVSEVIDQSIVEKLIGEMGKM
jgi:ABC-type nitrate/sulfonate/bicarbonate transport system substrate-binding protein